MMTMLMGRGTRLDGGREGMRLRCGRRSCPSCSHARECKLSSTPRRLFPSTYRPTSYLESIDTIFQDLPLLFPLHEPTPAHAFLSQDPHPSTAFLHTVTLYADRFANHDVGLRARSSTHCAIPSPTGPHATQWKCVLSSLAALPALREVRISLRFDPVEDHDLRDLARWAGPALAAKVTVELPRSEGLRVSCRECHAPPGRFIVPAGNAEDGGEGDEEECPAFGRVNWRDPLRYVVGREFFPPMPRVARDPGGDLCWYCSQWQDPDEEH